MPRDARHAAFTVIMPIIIKGGGPTAFLTMLFRLSVRLFVYAVQPLFAAPGERAVESGALRPRGRLIFLVIIGYTCNMLRTGESGAY